MTSATVRVARNHKRLPMLLLFVFIAAGIPDVLAKARPTSIWYELYSVSVSSGPDFDKLTVTAHREIHRPFSGEYRVAVWPASMESPTECKGAAKLDYQKASSRVLTVNTGWWIENQPIPCATVLRPGEYRMLTCVEVHPRSPLLFWLPPPIACTWSNVFSITEKVSS